MGKLGIGFVGCGRISDLHALGYRGDPDAEIRGVYDSDAGTAERKASAWGVARTYPSFEAMLADPAIDAVEILTPQAMHEEQTVAALRAGKHVSVQKPMATSLRSANRMVAEARKAGLVLKVAENYVHYPPLKLAKGLIEGGAIGEPMVFRAKMISGGGGGWEVPASAWAWRVKEYAAGRGMNTFDHGHHIWATAWYLMGEVDEVSAWIDSVDGLVDSPAAVNLRFSSPGRLGQCEFHYGKALEIPSKYYANDEWFDVSGSEGVLAVRRCTGSIQEGPAVAVFSGGSWTEHEAESDWAAGFAGSARNFVQAILGREPALPDAAQARGILAVDLAVARSDALSRPVYVGELDSPVPALYALGRRLGAIAKKRAFRARLAGGRCSDDEPSSASQAEKAAELTLALPGRFVPEAAKGFEGAFAVELGTACRGPFVVSVSGCRVEVAERAPNEAPLFVVRTRASSWASILDGSLSIEKAFMRGALRIEGGMTKALRLREMFGI